MKRKITRAFAMLFLIGLFLTAWGNTGVQASQENKSTGVTSLNNKGKAPCSISLVATAKPLKKKIALNKEIVVFKQLDWYGYKNTKTGAKTSADYSITWPFLNGRACAMRGDGGIEMLDTNLKVVWRSVDLEGLAPKIGQYENLSSDQFAAELKKINEMTTKKGKSPLQNYYNGLDYLQNVYGKNLHEYKPGEVSQWSKMLIQSVSESQDYFTTEVAKYHQYYQMQSDMQEYFEKRIKYWTPHY